MNCVLTFDPGIQLLLHEFFGCGELTQGDFRRAVALAHRANHLLLFLLVHLGIYVDPGYFSEEWCKDAKPFSLSRWEHFPVNILPSTDDRMFILLIINGILLIVNR